MTVVVPAVEIPPVPDVADAISLALPAGAKLVSFPGLKDGLVDQLAHVQSIMDQIGPAIAAVQPVFVLVTAVTSVFDLIQAVITGDVPGIVQAVQKAAEAISDMSTMLPQVAVPRLVADVLFAVVANLEAVVALVDELTAATLEAVAVIAQAQTEGDAILEAVGDTMLVNTNKLVEHACASLGPVGDLLGVLQGLLSLIPGGGPPLPGLPSCGGLPAAQLAIEIRVSIAAIKDHPLFPDPDAPTPPVIVTPVEVKAGVVLASAFVGQQAVVVFGLQLQVPYVVSVSSVTTDDTTYPMSITDRGPWGFVVNAGSTDLSDLVQVDWQVFPIEEVDE